MRDHGRALGFFWLVVVATGLPACGEDVPAARLGEEVFRDKTLSTSPFNTWTCATCHIVDPRAPAVTTGGRLDPGYNLGGSARRAAWWGGDRVRLLDAINVCLVEFMGGRALTADEPRARQLYEYLLRESPSPGPTLPLTIVRDVTDLSLFKGDPAQGQVVWATACRRCHGALHTGQGRNNDRVSVLPEDTIRVFGDDARAVTVEKVRHGKFINVGGIMPMYAVEVMSDQQLVDLLAYMGL